MLNGLMFYLIHIILQIFVHVTTIYFCHYPILYVKLFNSEEKVKTGINLSNSEN